MKFTKLRFLIAISTFGLGSIASGLTQLNYSVALVEVAPPETVYSAGSKLIEVSEADPNKERFTFLGHACGGLRNGWVQGYELPDGQRISTGLDEFYSLETIDAELSETLAKSERIIAAVEEYKNLDGVRGKRIIAEFTPEKTGENTVGIFWTGKGANPYEYIYEYVYAPTLEIALEFEQFQKAERDRTSSKRHNTNRKIRRR